jgi:hypothetical protein
VTGIAGLKAGVAVRLLTTLAIGVTLAAVGATAGRAAAGTVAAQIAVAAFAGGLVVVASGAAAIGAADSFPIVQAHIGAAGVIGG